MFKNLLMSCFTIVICPFFAGALPNSDIVFVGQIPNPTDFASANATFGNHLASVESIIRGGDLFIRYRNGKIRNLTRAAGFGNTGFQGADAIAVRDPAVSWDGKKVLFSMVIGSPTEQYRENQTYWQIFEISGLSESEVPVVEKIPFQPQNYNNISPIYGSDDTIFFTSDRPRNGPATFILKGMNTSPSRQIPAFGISTLGAALCVSLTILLRGHLTQSSILSVA